ncbi:MAG: hypothetical protein J3R72DRAFT_187096 [Linnemannia gamsii]|nr:MAG: hypothetical protein J3R72DRAFT_187096 [Linnemannia gamsii]
MLLTSDPSIYCFSSTSATITKPSFSFSLFPLLFSLFSLPSSFFFLFDFPPSLSYSTFLRYPFYSCSLILILTLLPSLSLSHTLSLSLSLSHSHSRSVTLTRPHFASLHSIHIQFPFNLHSHLSHHPPITQS